MHYRKITAAGTLVRAVPGNDYCNGYIAAVNCLHVDDVATILAEKGLDKRPDGK